MAEYALPCFAQSGNPSDEIGVDWADYPAIGAWLERIRATPRRVHPYALMPGHPLPSD